MLLISHRGNTDGPSPEENKPIQIEKVIKKGFNVEVDLWCQDDSLFLGHDKPEYKINFKWLLSYKDKLWIHCKNLYALEKMLDTNLNYFWHQEDDFTLTSHRFIWTFPNKLLSEKSIAVMPENSNYSHEDIEKCAGICTDYVFRYGRV